MVGSDADAESSGVASSPGLRFCFSSAAPLAPAKGVWPLAAMTGYKRGAQQQRAVAIVQPKSLRLYTNKLGYVRVWRSGRSQSESIDLKRASPL